MPHSLVNAVAQEDEVGVGPADRGGIKRRGIPLAIHSVDQFLLLDFQSIPHLF